MDEKNRIGIITQCYGSTNYGGVLQAYALFIYLKTLGFNVTQIRYVMSISPLCIDNKIKNIRITNKISNKLFRWINRRNLDNRKSVFDIFLRENIKMSNDLYDKNTISNSNTEYDTFIVGSDQVWNPIWFDPSFFLDFAYDDKTKIAYAASLGVKSLNDIEREYYASTLKKFSAISLREESAVQLIREVVPQPVYNTVDPTLLLDKNEWMQYTGEKKIQDKYMLCYFLTDDISFRHEARRIAKKYNYKIVTIPYMQNVFFLSDLFFGDIQLYDITPFDFLTYIRDAAFVLTDSFHATIFSQIFGTKFAVFLRKDKKEMGTRIIEILELFGNEKCLVSPQDIDILDIQSLSVQTVPNPYAVSFSKEYLKSSIKGI